MAITRHTTARHIEIETGTTIEDAMILIRRAKAVGICMPTGYGSYRHVFVSKALARRWLQEAASPAYTDRSLHATLDHYESGATLFLGCCDDKTERASA